MISYFDKLIFQGRGLNLAATEEDIQVFIGHKKCNVTNLSATQIFCTPPSDQPDGADEHGNHGEDFPVVMVTIDSSQFLLTLSLPVTTFAYVLR